MNKLNGKNFSLHDAEIITLHNDCKSDSGNLVLRCEDSSLIIINVYDIYHMRCDMFGRQNIASRIFISSKDQIEKEFFLKKLNWLYTNMVTLTAEKQEEIWGNCEKGIANLIYVEPSIGAEFAVLCSRFNISTSK